jgi:predicted transposase YbfD/YdcC
VPSEWTFRRVFTLLDPDHIESLLRANAKQIVEDKSPSDQIAVDGKAIRGSKRHDLRCLYSVSAWCHENGLVLGEIQSDSKSNEITAIPLLLESLDLKTNTVTIDAAGCQKSIAEIIVKKKGDYVLGLKRNHPKLYDAVKEYVNKIGESNENRLFDAFDDSHGRSVRRRVFGYDVSKLPETQDWLGAKTVVAVETISSKDNDPSHKVRAEWRYYLSSHKCTDKRLPGYIRNHWGIENKLHWVLDVHLKEDDDQKAERKSVRSFALLKRIALNIVRSNDFSPKKRSLRRKLKRSGWDNDYLLSLLS